MPRELLQELLEHNPDELRTVFAQTMPADLADALATFSDEELAAMLPHIEPAMLAVVVQEFDTDQVHRLLSLESPARILQIINEMSSDDATDLLKSLPVEQRSHILAALPPESDLHELLHYEEESSGALMTIEFLSVRPEWSTDKALQVVRVEAQKAETAYYIYVTSQSGHLVGVLSLRELVLAKPNTPISAIMRTDPIKVTDDEDQEQVANLFKRYDLVALPVVDEQGILKGIVTSDDIMDVVDEEATEDIERMAALHPSDTPYLTTPILKLAGQRLAWLLILMISATFTGQIMRHYEDVLSQVIYLTVFIPMLMDTGGNAGSQSSTLIIRGLALGDITLQDRWKVVLKEFTVSILVGVCLAAVNFVRILFIEKYPAPIAAAVSLTLIVTVMLAKIIGGILPLAAKRLHIDPAIMAGPLITTIVDALALIAYFNIAGAILGLE